MVIAVTAVLTSCHGDDPADTHDINSLTQSELVDWAASMLDELSCEASEEIPDDPWFWDGASGFLCEYAEGRPTSIFVYETAGSPTQSAGEWYASGVETRALVLTDHLLVFGEREDLELLASRHEAVPAPVMSVDQVPMTPQQERLTFCVRSVSSFVSELAEGDMQSDSDMRELDDLFPGYEDHVRSILDGMDRGQLSETYADAPLAFTSLLGEYASEAKVMCDTAVAGEGSMSR